MHVHVCSHSSCWVIVLNFQHNHKLVIKQFQQITYYIVIKLLIHITCNYAKELIVVITNMPATCTYMFVHAAINSPLLDLIRWPQECQNIPTSKSQSCVCTCPRTPGINNSHTSLTKCKLLGNHRATYTKVQIPIVYLVQANPQQPRSREETIPHKLTPEALATPCNNVKWQEY